MQRIEKIKSWLHELGFEQYDWEPASSDASFRRYFRLTLPTQDTYIVMDAPPYKEDTAPFIQVSNLFADIGLNVPLVKYSNIEEGFLLLSDLGDVQYLSVLQQDNVQQLYDDALKALCTLQVNAPKEGLPLYDKALLMREMELFREWYLKKHLGLRLSPKQEVMLSDVFELLAHNALEQVQVCVHRDYHSRNLMVTKANNPGILDFQDAVVGPVTYDLVSLLKDCYITWPTDQVESWALGFLHQLTEAGTLPHTSDEQLLQWFNWMGVQRHLKATGIFARLDQRDRKPAYLQDIPRTLAYVLDVTDRYEALHPLNDFINSVKPVYSS